jgi:precorrin-8X/cobalt-precorrin-8 methylmutase
MINYLRNGDDIYRQSFALIRAEANLENLAADLIPIAVRLIHACGMTDIGSAIAASEKAVKIGREALQAGVPILCDAQMVAHGIIRSHLPARNPIICTLNDPQVPAIAQQIDNTRSAAAIELWKPHLKDAIVTIGNAPTALFHLLELLDQGAAKPALILGFPVGFVGAAESKAELMAHSRGVAFITLQGRRGGSAIAAAAVNALAQETEQ